MDKKELLAVSEPLGPTEAHKRYQYLLDHIPAMREAMKEYDGLHVGAGFDNLTRIIRDLGIALGFEPMPGNKPST